jgi:hypothetical protein
MDRRQNGAGIVHILKFYGFYEVVYVIPWLGASFAKNCGTPGGDRRHTPVTIDGLSNLLTPCGGRGTLPHDERGKSDQHDTHGTDQADDPG